MNLVHKVGVLALAAPLLAAGWMALAPQEPEAPRQPVKVIQSTAQGFSVLAFGQSAAEPASGTPAPPQGAAPAQPSAPAAESDAERLARQLREGSEPLRLAALVQARTEGTLVPDALLRRLMAGDPSDRMRLLAFETQLEQQSGNLETLRATLQAALAIPHPALQARAREQLLAIEQMQQATLASDPQP